MRYKCQDCGKTFRTDADTVPDNPRCLKCGGPLWPVSKQEAPPSTIVLWPVSKQEAPPSTIVASTSNPTPPSRNWLAWLIGGVVAVAGVAVILLTFKPTVNYSDSPISPTQTTETNTASQKQTTSAPAVSGDSKSPRVLAKPPETTTAPAAADSPAHGLETTQPARARAVAPMSPKQLFAKASPAVVVITTFDTEGNPAGLGSGFFVSAKGLLVTNYHVIESASKAIVHLHGEMEAPVKWVCAVDKDSDLALLMVDVKNASFLQVSQRARPNVGTRVYAIGNPQGLNNTLSEGLVSGLPRIGEIDLIQTTAPISPGSSGGPLLTEYGIVVGVTTGALTSGQNLNFAVPAERIRKLFGEHTERPQPWAEWVRQTAQENLRNKSAPGPVTEEPDIQTRLEEPISVDLIDVPIEDLAAFLQQMRKVNIVLDARLLERPKDNRQYDVTMRLDKVKFREALELICRQVHLQYRIVGNSIFLEPIK